MKDLKHEDCNLLGLDSLLQVNEVFEKFQQTEVHDSCDKANDKASNDMLN